jgi:hypothetical protein
MSENLRQSILFHKRNYRFFEVRLNNRHATKTGAGHGVTPEDRRMIHKKKNNIENAKPTDSVSKVFL